METTSRTSDVQFPLSAVPDWPWHRVLYELAERGLNCTRLGAQMDPPVTQVAVSRVALVPMPRIQAAIAQAIGLSPLAIWPSRYDPLTGQPVRRTEWLAARGRDYNGAPIKSSPAEGEAA